MTICFVSHSARKGGAEWVLLETLKILRNYGMNCRVMLPENGELCDELKKLDIPFRIIPYGLWMSRGKPNFWLQLKALARILITLPKILLTIQQWKADVVYSNTLTVPVGAFAAVIARRPHVWHIHEFGYEDHGLLFIFGKKLSLGIVNALSTKCIFVSRTLASKYSEDINERKIKTIYCAMNRLNINEERRRKVKYSLPLGTEGFRCLILGSVIEGKGQEDAVNAIAELNASQIRAELFIVGRDYLGYGKRLKEIVTRRGLKNQVVFIGHVDNPFPFIESADVILVCSRSEAFGRVTIEAMLAGKPVIGAKSGATPELIDDGFNGLLYAPGNHRDLANKIRYLYENPEVSRCMGINGKKWAASFFTRERYLDELIALLRSL